MRPCKPSGAANTHVHENLWQSTCIALEVNRHNKMASLQNLQLPSKHIQTVLMFPESCCSVPFKTLKVEQLHFSLAIDAKPRNTSGQDYPLVIKGGSREIIGNGSFWIKRYIQSKRWIYLCRSIKSYLISFSLAIFSLCLAPVPSGTL